MHFVSLFVEILRTRPVAVFWAATLAQAALWTLAPTLFYAAPPGRLPEVLAIGHEFLRGTDFGPPLAYWLAELTFRAAGMFGVYLLSQLCVIVAYWAVFTLGRQIVGDRHAALAVLLMAGVAAFTVPTPEFGPGILATAIWALVLLHGWRAIGQGRQAYWISLGIEIGLLLLTTYAAFVLLGLLLLYLLAFRLGRIQLASAGPWIAGVIVVLVFFPHLTWLDQNGGGVTLAGRAEIEAGLRTWAGLCGLLIVGHAGLLILVLLVRGFALSPRKPTPEIERAPVDPEARRFVYFFAFAPLLAISALALVSKGFDAAVGAPLVLLSGLAVIVTAPDRIRVAHQRLVGYAWAGLLILPPLIVAAAVIVLPATMAVDLRVAQPAAEIGPFFADRFQRRTGLPLAVVTGNPRLAELASITTPSRPWVYLDATPERSPWVTRQTVDDKGAVVLWSATDARGTPPAAILVSFPGLAAEVPQAFERRVQGRMPPMRIGWGIVAPKTSAAETPQAAPAQR